MKILMGIVAALALGAPAATLSGDKALVIPAQDIKAQLAQLAPAAKATGSAGPVIASYGNLGLMLSVRTANGGGEVHKNFDDLMIVQQGSATLVTGGSLVDPKPGDNGEIRGISVKDGNSQPLKVGDVVIVPAGLPHQLLVKPGTVYAAMVAKIKES